MHALPSLLDARLDATGVCVSDQEFLFSLPFQMQLAGLG
jgi:hypothetical protein